MINSTVSHYKIIQKLGEGGMGEVYKAEDLNLKRMVALKFLPPGLSHHPEAKKRFINEARSASALDHHNILNIYEISETDDEQLFIVMACYEGENLKEVIDRGPLSIGQVTDFTLQICEGLNKAHQNKIIHRDIKPANIFITKDGIIKILDFGLAKIKGHTRITQKGTATGTVDYMSPEQAVGKEVDQRTDIWSLGVVIFEMITGSKPFKADYDQAVIFSILNNEPDFSKIPKELVPILKKALTKSPDYRYQTIDEMLNDLIFLKTGTKTRKRWASILQRKSHVKVRRLISAVIFLALILVIYFSVNNLINVDSSLKTNTTSPMKMIVVIPFKNLGLPEDEYLAQGITEEISYKLASFAELGVISSNSAEKYANSKKSGKEIGQELGVDYILTGTLQWPKNKNKENNVRIISQLIRAADDINIWSESYDRVLNDIFYVQNEISQKVVDKLGVKLLPNRFLSGNQPTNNLDAYDYYLKGLRFKYKVSHKNDVLTSISLYNKAIELDSNFAAAHAQIAISYMGLFARYYDRDSINVFRAQKHLQIASELNPDLPDVHLARAFYYNLLTFDNEQAFKEFKKTLELQPNNAEANIALGVLYSDKGEFELEFQYTLKAFSLDPLTARYAEIIGMGYWFQRDFRNAVKYFNRAIELSPNTIPYYEKLAEVYLWWDGNTKNAHRTLGRISKETVGKSEKSLIELNIFDRNFNAALGQLKNLKNEYVDNWFSFIPKSQVTALVYRFMKQDELSKKYFEISIMDLEKKLREDANDFRIHGSMSISYAGLNNKEKAIGEYEKHFELFPFQSPVIRRYYSERDLAKIYTLTGDYDNAFKQIDSLLSKPSYFSVSRLEVDPLYDPLRNLTGYKEIIEKYKN